MPFIAFRETVARAGELDWCRTFAKDHEFEAFFGARPEPKDWGNHDQALGNNAIYFAEDNQMAVSFDLMWVSDDDILHIQTMPSFIRE